MTINTEASDIAGMEEDDSIWGGTKEIADRPRGRKAMARGRVREGDVPPPAKSTEAILFKHSFKSKATLQMKNSINFLLNQLAACYFCNTTDMHNQH